MPDIQVLSPHVADLIAAGEVVERPASVVKELMENAIDAGARSVTVEIANGGMSLIRVTDDGCGIAPGQAATAFLRHATSKIASEYDLEAIGTLGFRGEALAAISAVSRVELLTRQADSPFGTLVRLEGGVVTSQEEAGCPAGTTMAVRDLFFNTPARLKFMKRDQAEGAAVFAVVQREALAHPEVAVKFLRDGKQELLTSGDGALKSAIYAVFGRDIALGFIPVKGSGEDIGVEGFASLPVCCRGSRNYQHFFVNGRYVKSRTMQAAVEEAYKNQKMVGKFPGCVLHLSTKLSTVDVNVHPTKTEVKFTSEHAVFSAIYHTVQDALEQSGQRPAAVVAPAAAAPVQTAFPKYQNPYGTLTLHDAQPSPFSERGAAGETPPSVPAQEEPPATAPEAVPVLRVAPVPEVKPRFTPATRAVNISPPEDDFDAAEPALAVLAPAVPAAPVRPAEPVSAAAPQSAPEPEQAPLEQAEEEEEKPWIIRGELFRTYILVEQGETTLLIDKHAAHERMNFDRLKAAGWTPMCQQLLTPVILNLAPEERSVLLEQQELLAQFGFELEEFGGGALAVRQAPDDISAGEIENTLAGLAQRLLTTGTADPAGARDELLHTMACKAAIKGGWKNGNEELEVVAKAVMSGQVRYCPHGRPVAIELTKKQLEKQFKRV